MWMHGQTKQLESDRLIAVAGLRARLFNSSSCSLKLLLSGYYQEAVSFIRDILEITFLANYFTVDDTAIDRWVKNPDEKEFKAVNIRSALDKRGGLSEQKRK